MIIRRVVRTACTTPVGLLYSQNSVNNRLPVFIRMASSLPSTPIFKALSSHDPKSVAVIHSASQRTFTYGNLLHDVAAAKAQLASIGGNKSLAGERIAFLAEHGYDYVGKIPPRIAPITRYMVSHENAADKFLEDSDVSIHPGPRCNSPSYISDVSRKRDQIYC